MAYTRKKFINYAGAGICGLYVGCNFLPAAFGRSLMPKFNPAIDKSTLREAMFFEETPYGPMCKICPNECIVKEGKFGDCRTRTSKDGKLYTTAYANPCAIHVDPVEKKPLYHFHPSEKIFSIAIAGCNFTCLNCQNWSISQASPEETRNYDLSPASLVANAKSYGCKMIAFTYSEPTTFYEYVFDSSKKSKESNFKNVLVSNGYINEKPLRKLSPYIDAANIDLKAFSDEIYKKLCGGTLDPVLNTLKVLKEEDVWLEITNLVVPEWTDDLGMIKDMCQWLVDNGFSDYPLHFSRFHPQYKLTRLPSTPVKVLNKARAIALDAGIKFVYIGNVPGTTASNTVCTACGSLLIERKGFRILKNEIVSGRCKKCSEVVPGRWEG